MTTNDKRWRWAALAVGLIAALGLWRMGSSTAVAQRAAGGPCCCVGSIDLPRVLQGLDERAERETELQAFIQERLERIQQIEDRIEQLRADLDILPVGSEAWRAKREEIMTAIADLQKEQNFLQRFGAELEANMKLDLFNKIVDAASRYAEREGIAMVVADDSGVEIPRPLNPDETRQVEPAIVGRRVLHSSSCADITSDVITMMNVEFAAQ